LKPPFFHTKNLTGFAKLNGIDPQAYLRHVLTNIADYPVHRVADLLPWNVADELTPVSA
jgi:transposase